MSNVTQVVTHPTSMVHDTAQFHLTGNNGSSTITTNAPKRIGTQTIFTLDWSEYPRISGPLRHI
jgi:hypothetical protein